MTKKQQEFYRILVNQMVDYNEDFHKEFTIKRIEQISDEKLKYLLEDINTNKDKVARKKGYITYAKFIYYADKMIDEKVELLLESKISKVEQLYNKRELILKTIQNETKSINQRNQLIENIQNKVLMFKDEYNKNILDEIDYFIIEKFGFFNFFDENRNYMVKEEIEEYFKQYKLKTLLPDKNQRKLINI